MGAPKEEPESQDSERPQRLVKVSQFLMGRYAVTQAQWRVVAGYSLINRELREDPSSYKGDNRPVENVSWEEAQEFCKRLSVRSRKKYQLPSEAQWEYACRAGTETPFHFGEMITNDLVNNHGDTQMGTTDVGSLPANDWGLYAMHGNVWEWCQDDWHESYDGAPNNDSVWEEPFFMKMNSLKPLRGGNWNCIPLACRSASRSSFFGDGLLFDHIGIIGFRVCCVLPKIFNP